VEDDDDGESDDDCYDKYNRANTDKVGLSGVEKVPVSNLFRNTDYTALCFSWFSSYR
jgi:hypothetical protein